MTTPTPLPATEPEHLCPTAYVCYPLSLAECRKVAFRPPQSQFNASSQCPFAILPIRFHQTHTNQIAGSIHPSIHPFTYSLRACTSLFMCFEAMHQQQERREAFESRLRFDGRFDFIIEMQGI